ncbi:Gfo/Idh/MocA family oxidoreductase [Fusibacter tunisiensis]|uniref:Dehydrogenase n=1 Tax=Fusibacter tunisiensis TaxID=1008308 RepID=A0ABS2MN30_9FIRM|nr:Gfo/Idh/MocA family oxidoreductase [Fusibacter tunisiensis]MBM7560804.1 putative dehydrogenase [Fusibacter tunisiensis]
MNSIKVAIVGYGLSGRVFHANLLTSMPEFQIRGVMTNDPIKQKDVICRHAGALIYTQFEEVLADDLVELIIISAPNTMHYKMASEALKKGKHVVVEKPFTVTLNEALDLHELALAENKIVSVYHNRRFDGDFMTIQKLLQEGHLGRVVSFESHFDRFRPEFKAGAWREKNLPGSGVLYDLGSHLIDQAIALFGMPNEIYADLMFQRHGLVDDGFDIFLYYDAVKVLLRSSSLVKAKLPRFILMGTEGSFVKYGMDPQEALLKENICPSDIDQWGEDAVDNWGILNTINDSGNTYKTLNGDYRAYYQKLYRSIRFKEPVPVSSTCAVQTMQLIECAIQSHREKRRIHVTSIV